MTPRIGRLPKAITLIPLAALSAAWTVDAVNAPSGDVSSLVSQSSTQAPSPQSPEPAAPGSALVVPPQSLAPASVSGDGAGAPGAATAAPAMLSTPLIPPVALAAYQRAATVIDTADRACHLDWSLIAAIGRVESNHGSHGGSQLGADGRVTPAIIGPALNGLNGTLLVTDTDGGRLDGDTRFDHAVGPMQFLPSTWSTVGVDADGDGQRDPQDINDAALAAAVYLCSGADDLSTDAGRRAALLRYNHSGSYVDTVLSIAAQYQSGAGLDAALPVGFVAARAVSLTPAVDTGQGEGQDGTRKHRRHHASAGFGTVADPAGQPAGDPAGGQHGTPSEPDPTPSTPPAGTPDPEVPATAEQLTDLCDTSIAKAYPDATDAVHAAAVQACAQQLDGTTLDKAKAQIDDVVTALPDTVAGLDPEPTASSTPTTTTSSEPKASESTPTATVASDSGDPAPADPAPADPAPSAPAASAPADPAPADPAPSAPAASAQADPAPSGPAPSAPAPSDSPASEPSGTPTP